MSQSPLADLMRPLATAKGSTPTAIPDVELYRWDSCLPRQSINYRPGLFFIGQGRKVGYLDGNIFPYDASHYLVMSVPMPFECETIASVEEPLLGMRVGIDLTMLHEMTRLLGDMDMAPQDNRPAQRGVHSAPLKGEVLEAVVRLLQCLQSDQDCRVLGPALAREVLYRVLCDGQAPSLFALMEYNGHMTRVARSLRFIHDNLASSLSVEDLAKEAHMSVSAFHRSFKDITGDSPIQYIKRTRLSQARLLIAENGARVNAVAHRVGYESPSQFSREFKRLYGMTPKEAAIALPSASQ